MRRVLVLGVGCAKCRKLAENAQAAVDCLGIDCAVDRITDLVEILKFDISATPALILGGQVKSAGRVLSIEEIAKLLTMGQSQPGPQ